MQPDGVRLLCVDDDQYLVDLLRYALEREGFAVQTAHTAHDAMRLLIWVMLISAWLAVTAHTCAPWVRFTSTR